MVLALICACGHKGTTNQAVCFMPEKVFAEMSRQSLLFALELVLSQLKHSFLRVHFEHANGYHRTLLLSAWQLLGQSGTCCRGRAHDLSGGCHQAGELVG